MLEFFLLIAKLTVSGEPGDTIACRKMIGAEVHSTAMVILPPMVSRSEVYFYLLPDEVGVAKFDCGKMPPR